MKKNLPLAGAALLVSAWFGVAYAQDPSGLQQTMFYRSFIQDDPSCSVVAQGGQAVFQGPTAASAAVSCPDAFAWAQFAEAIAGEWWNWGLDQTVWPGTPLPLCSATVTSNCCNPDAAIDPDSAPNTSCPVFRGDYTTPSPLPAVLNGTPAGGVLNHGGLVLPDEIDPGRLLRDLELELVFRNKAMTDYIYRNDLYSKEGLGSRNRAQNTAIQAGNIAAAHKLEVRFPVDAVMVKADFLHQQILLDQGLITDTDGNGNPIDPPNNPDYPYLTVYLEGDGSQGSVPGWYYMLAMTNASKDVPIWHWYAMEHVANRGRCDYIGCNDSFGYAANGTAQAGADFGATYIPPMIELNDDKTSGNEPLFVTGKVYDPTMTGEAITPGLAALLQGLGVAVSPVDRDPGVITVDDPAWLNYRLKGTQSSFVTAGGVPTGTGATITEGGFVNSASCATCHSQASVNADGSAGMQGVGSTWRPNLLGFNQVEMGSPDMAWFYNFSGGAPNVAATQIDFIWGIFNAACQAPAGSHGTCTTYPDAPNTGYAN